MDIYNKILSDNKNIKKAHESIKQEPFRFRLIRLYKKLQYFIYKNPQWNLKRKDVIVLNHSRRVRSNGIFECLYTDEILNYLDYDYYVFEKSYMGMHYTPIRTKNIKYTDYFNLKLFLKTKLIKIKVNKNSSDYKNIESLTLLINNHFNCHIDVNELYRTIMNRYNYYETMKLEFENIIDRVKPKVIVEVVSYGIDKLVWNLVAKRKGIPVVELQHGTMGRNHIAYNSYINEEIETFPDYILTFGDYWKYNTEFPLPLSRIHSVGWPYYERRLSENKPLHEANNYKTILFISQGTIGFQLSEIAYELSHKLDPRDYKIIFKLHPGEYSRWKKEYSDLMDSDITVVENSEKDMHYYFQKSDIVVGVYSTAIFEALGYNLRTFIVNLFGHRLMEDLYNNNFATLICSVDELAIKVNSENRGTHKMDTSNFWKKNSLENTVKKIDEIIKSNS